MNCPSLVRDGHEFCYFASEDCSTYIQMCPSSPQVDVNDAVKTAEAFLKISSVYKDKDEEVKMAVLDSVGERLRPTHTHFTYLSVCVEVCKHLLLIENRKCASHTHTHTHTNICCGAYF